MLLHAFIVMHLINAGLRAFISVACFSKWGGLQEGQASIHRTAISKVRLVTEPPLTVPHHHAHPHLLVSSCA